ncbi:unnamed protein product [Malus baccata var. baccata]
MWYFFAIQRMMRCWHFACRKDDGCDNKIFRCHDHHAFRNATILNDLCPLISSDTVPSNFGIFATVLQYGIVGSTNYFQKFSNCFCWGLQNLSSFGSNLHPSADGWENLYTALVSIIGLLLFLYLIGNLQMYMQIAATRTENHKHRLVMKQKRKEKGREIELLLFKNGIATELNKNIKSRIMRKVKQALYDSMDADLNNIFPLLPSEVQSRIKEPLAWLKQVPIFREMDEVVLKKIYEHLKPVKYNENSDIIQKGQPLDKMIFIVDGELCDSYSAPKLYGEELLRWPFSTSFPRTKPLATESVKAILTKKNKKSIEAIGVVEALALKACDLESIYMQPDIKRREEPRHKKMMKEEIEQHMHPWMRKNGIPERLNNEIKLRIMNNLALDDWNTLPSDWYNLVSRLPLDLQNQIKSYMPLTKLKKMSEFQNMKESVLKQICSHLRPMKYYDGQDIIAKGDPIQMLFIVDGYISDLSFNEKGPGEIYGEELLLWPFLTSFPDRVPTVAESPFVVFECAEVLVLTAKYMESVATEFRKHFIKNYGRLVQSFTEEETKEAIRNHSCHNYKNEGGYGIVYEATLNGTAVAIKTCNSAPIGDRFIQSQILVHEAFVLSQIRHKNVVRLLGCCLETEWPIMVYDRTSAWTLYELIHMKGPKLMLQLRMKIAAETAGALKYLHSMSVIHQDVKTANILIDHATHIAKLSGFGASRLLVDDEGEMEDEVSTLAETQWLDDDDGETKEEVLTLPESWGEDEVSTLHESWGEDEISTLPKSSGEGEVSTLPEAEVSTLPKSSGEGEVSTLPEAEVSTLPETTGYSDPEYLKSHVLTEKSDVYSFGVVLVELLTSQEAVSSDGSKRSLANVFLCSMQKGHLHQILDLRVFKDEFSFEIAERVSKLAETCLGPRGKERPSMEEVAAELDRVVQTIMNRAQPSTEDNNMSPASRTSK